MNLRSLYPYQREGATFLYTHDRAYLADGMGLGKTAQAITAAAMASVRDITVVCPASAVPNWQAEWDLWRGPGEPRIVSYSSLIRRKWRSWQAGLVILDEAHYCKTPSAQRTRAALGLSRKADRAWLLSGTPMPNDPTELWAPIKVLWPELAQQAGCRTKMEWMQHFCYTRPTLYGPKPYGVQNGAELRRLLQGIMLRRQIADVGLDLPPLRVDLFRLPQTAKLASALGAYENLAGMDDAAEYTSTLRRLLGEAKAPAVAKQVADELNDNAYRKVVVLYYHKSVRDALAKGFLKAGLSVTGFGGETPHGKRAEAIRQFQEDPSIRVFLAQQTAAGIAINLTAAHEVVLVEPSWSPEDNKQAIKRVHRIGQDQPCRARLFTISGTMDEAILGTIRTKLKMQLEVGL